MSTATATTSKPLRRSARAASPRVVVLVPNSASERELVRARRIAAAHDVRLGFAVADELFDGDRPALVVVGPKRGYFGRLVAERAAARLQCPVLQVRNVGSWPYPHVVLATEVGSALPEMVAAARFVAPGAPMLFLHAYENPFEPMLSLHGVARATLGRYRREYAKLSRDRVREHMKRSDLGGAPLRLQHGAPRFVLRRVPRRALLVIHRGRSRLKHVFLGSVTHWVLEESACDVLVV